MAPKFKPTAIAIALSLAMTGGAQGATINVNAGCTLVDAIISANTNELVASCVVGDSTARDTISLQNGSVILSGVVASGSAIGENGLPLVISDITIEGNSLTVSRDGGAPEFRIFNVGPGADLTLNDLTISNGQLTNTSLATAGSGAGLFSEEAIVTLNNVTISGNTADLNGGGLFSLEGDVVINNSTISGNSSARGAGGLQSRYRSFVTAPNLLTLNGTTVTGNTSG